jgi:aubergine-like protein
VVDVEVAQFLQAIEASEKKMNLIFVITNKRVSAKFYTSNFDNPQPGCVVDQKITEGNDFYLIAQKTTQGTVTPTHYKILHNDLKAEQGTSIQL